MRKIWILGLALLSLPLLTSCGRPTETSLEVPDDFGKLVHTFIGIQRQLDQTLSKRLNLPLPAVVSNFYDAADSENLLVISNTIQQMIQSEETGETIPALQNELWAPIHETSGLIEVWEAWNHNSALLKMFYNPIFKVMPKGSIYFGGTEEGRFVIAAVNAVQKSPPIICITQNALADGTYLSHLQAIYGNQCRIPDCQDGSDAFKRLAKEVQSGEFSNTYPASGVMHVNGMLCKLIFDWNKSSHAFFVEESYVLDWMYPYLEPCGLIMKLNPDPLAALSEETVSRDHEFWKQMIQRLEAQPGFIETTDARDTFGKVRSAIGGLYAYRKMNTDAEKAFRQSIRLSPTAPEPTFRLSKFLAEQDRHKEAIDVVAAFVACNPEHSKEAAMAYLKQLKAESKHLTNE